MRRLPGLLAAPILAVAAAILLVAALPPRAGDDVVRTYIEGQDASCAPATFRPGATLDQQCGDTGGKKTSGGGGGGGSGFLADAGPLVLLAVAAGGVLLLGAAVVLVRTRRVEVAAPTDEWWTCPRCGAGNVVGAARCHRCGSWRAAERQSTPSATR